jgi:hypothetical protein
MWEVGYAMALAKPIVVITQSLEELPFDLKDMQSLEYERNHLSGTLAKPLQRMIVDTLSADHTRASQSTNASAQDELISELRNQVNQLKGIVSQAVSFWSPREPAQLTIKDNTRELASLEGAWRNKESGSYLYAALVDSDLIVPYCFAGNDKLIGVYSAWRRVGEHWFSRFTWLDGSFAGFSFLKQNSLDVLTGAWWLDETGIQAPSAPPDVEGVTATLERLHDVTRPDWATRFIEDVRREGLAGPLARR